MKLSRAAITLYLGIVFASGGVLGFYANRLYAVSSGVYAISAKPGSAPRSPDEFRKGLVSFYKSRLQLTDDQSQKLELILDEANAQYQAQFKHERENSRPELNRIHMEQVDRIKAMLTPAQQPEYEKMLKEREKLRQQKKSGRTGGPGV